MKTMEKSLFGVYNRSLAYCQLRLLNEHKETYKKLEQKYGINLEDQIKNIKTLRGFDRLITAKTNDYGVPDNYYRESSLGKRLMNIKIPTLLLSAVDDPVIGYLLHNY